jgi:hypothetical protein
MSNHLWESIRKWISTIAEVVAIIGAIAAFIKLFSDNVEMREQLKQTTIIAVAADSTVREMREQTKIMADQTELNRKRINKEELRYIESLKPRFMVERMQLTQGSGLGASLFNIGNQAEVFKIDIGNKNNCTVEINPTLVKENSYLGFSIQSPEKEVPILDVIIFMQDIEGTIYKQRFYTDKDSYLLIDKPIRLY